jgi:hypothetical protein
VLVVEAYTPSQAGRGTGGPSDPTLMPTLSALKSELSGLDFMIARELTRSVVEGPGHTGDADVVQALARKPAIPG